MMKFCKTNYQSERIRYNVLKKLTKLSKNDIDQIAYSPDFTKAFKNIPTDELFKILIVLCNRMYIDCDYLDADNYTFKTIIILPAAREALTAKRNSLFSALSAFLAFVSAVTGIIAILH